MSRPRNSDIIRDSRERILIFDGGMGSEIIRRNPARDDFRDHPGCLEYLVFSRPDIIADIHASFLQAGCDVVETDTLGASRHELSLSGLENETVELNYRAATLARSVVLDFHTADRPRYVSGSIGPGSKLPSLGQIRFRELEESYHCQAEGLLSGGVDLIQIETVQDLLQAKAALHGVERAMRRQGREVPVVVQLSLENGRTILGTDMRTAIRTLAPFSLFALGANCGGGPAEMTDAARALHDGSPFPMMIMPNAGKPRLHEGKTVYDLQPEEFARQLVKLTDEYGIHMVGGCCGSTPAHLQALVRGMGTRVPAARNVSCRAAVSSLCSFQELATIPRPLLIAERANASGSRRFREALGANDFDRAADLACGQQQSSHLLDLSVAQAGRNEITDMGDMVERLLLRLRNPLVLDSADPRVLETGLQRYGGRPLLNSIHLQDGGGKAGEVIRLAREYGAGVICLAIDELGMARTRQRKRDVCLRLLDMALAAGLRPADLLFDPLTFSLASGDPDLADAAVETLEALRLIKESVPESFTLLGVSNISHGLPSRARRILNMVFLQQALTFGLDAAILNGEAIVPLDQIPAAERAAAEDLIFNRRSSGADPLAKFLGLYADFRPTGETAPVEADADGGDELKKRILEGLDSGLPEFLDRLRETVEASEIVGRFLLPAMEWAGGLFASGRLPLPFVLRSAEIVRKALAHLAPYLSRGETIDSGCILLATVKGDIHDIGKNLVGLILKSSGYRVVDIGVDRDGAEIAGAVESLHPDFIGLSSLLLSSALEIGGVLRELNGRGIRLPVICGGAALNEDFVRQTLQPHYQGCVHFAPHAWAAAELMRRQPSMERKTGAPRR